MQKIKSKKISILIFGIFLPLIIATVFFAIKASMEGSMLLSLEKESETLAAQNRQLQADIVNSTSLTKVSETAKSFGMSEPEKYIYMNQHGIAFRGQ